MAHARSISRDLEFTTDQVEPRRGAAGADAAWPATVPQLDSTGQPPSSLHQQNFNGDDTTFGVRVSLPPIGEDPSWREKGKPLPLAPVTWMSLPRKDQLLILFITRLVDFLQVASLQAYVFYQLKDINRDLTDAQISAQAGWLQGCFTGAQVMTAILWGKAADAHWCGRKWVLVIGMGGTAISCLGYGFATTFFWAAFWRMFGGAINGTVGIIRTMVAEITKEKRYQSRAFLILPMSFNVASILGPIMGGMLAEPAKTFPRIFGEGQILGFKLFRDYPFALPSLMNCAFMSFATMVTYLFLEETLVVRKHKYDSGLHLQRSLKQKIWGGKSVEGYERAPMWTSDMTQSNSSDEKPTPYKPPPPIRRLPFAKLWTRNVIFTLITSAVYDFQLGGFTNIWSLFLSTTRYITDAPTNPESLDASAAPPPPALQDGVQQRRRDLPLLFTGGLGMPASTVGVATSFLGIIGMILQVTLYPPVQARLGTMRSYRWFLLLFPVAYFVAPYLSILPSSSPPPEPASGSTIWTGILFVLLLQVTARTFTLPASIILLNNSSPHPSVLGTIHGLGQSVSAGFRTVGPIVGGWWYGYGLDIGMVAWGWWGVAAVSAVGCLTSYGMYEGTGHEIFLEGELDETGRID